MQLQFLKYTVPIVKQVTRINNNGDRLTKNLSYILQFIDSARLMVSSLSNTVNNPSEGIHRFKCKFGHSDKKWETCGIKYKYCGFFLG